MEQIINTNKIEISKEQDQHLFDFVNFKKTKSSNLEIELKYLKESVQALDTAFSPQ